MFLKDNESSEDHFFDCQSKIGESSDGALSGVDDCPPAGGVTSTPLPAGKVGNILPVDVSPFKLGEEDDPRFVLLPSTKNKKQPKCVVYSSDSDTYPIQDVVAPRWKKKDRVGNILPVDVSPFKLGEEDDQRFVLLPSTKNKKRPKCVVYSSDSDTYPIQDVVAPRWKKKDIRVVKYVDDQT